MYKLYISNILFEFNILLNKTNKFVKTINIIYIK